MHSCWAVQSNKATASAFTRLRRKGLLLSVLAKCACQWSLGGQRIKLRWQVYLFKSTNLPVKETKPVVLDSFVGFWNKVTPHPKSRVVQLAPASYQLCGTGLFLVIWSRLPQQHWKKDLWNVVSDSHLGKNFSVAVLDSFSAFPSSHLNAQMEKPKPLNGNLAIPSSRFSAFKPLMQTSSEFL